MRSLGVSELCWALLQVQPLVSRERCFKHYIFSFQVFPLSAAAIASRLIPCIFANSNSLYSPDANCCRSTRAVSKFITWLILGRWLLFCSLSVAQRTFPGSLTSVFGNRVSVTLIATSEYCTALAGFFSDTLNIFGREHALLMIALRALQNCYLLAIAVERLSEIHIAVKRAFSYVYNFA